MMTLLSHWLRPRVGGGDGASTRPVLVGPWLGRRHGGTRTLMPPGPRGRRWLQSMSWAGLVLPQDLQNSSGSHSWWPQPYSSLPSGRAPDR